MAYPNRIHLIWVALTLGIGLFPWGICHAIPCVVPNDGSDTVDFPPDCPYTAPVDLMMIIDGLPPGTTIEVEPVMSNLVCYYPQPCEEPGGILGGTRTQFYGILEMVLTGTGDLAGFTRTISMPMDSDIHFGPRMPGDPIQVFPSEWSEWYGQIYGDPDFDSLQVVGGTYFGYPSPGQTILTELPSGEFNVDSFFDVTYQIDFIGAPGGALGGLNGSTTGTVRLGQGELAPPSPTPTPAPIPSTSPTGLGVILMILGGLIGLSAIRKRD